MTRDDKFGRYAVVIQVSPRRWAVATRTIADWEYELPADATKFDSPNEAKILADTLNGVTPKPAETATQGELF